MQQLTDWSEHLTVHAECNGNGRLPHPSTPRVDEDPLPLAQQSPDHKGIVGSGVRYGNGRGFLQRPLVWDVPHKVGVSSDGRGQTLGCDESHDSLAVVKATGELEAEDAVLKGEVACGKKLMVR